MPPLKSLSGGDWLPQRELTVGMGQWEWDCGKGGGWLHVASGEALSALLSSGRSQAADWTGQGSCASSLGSLAHLMGEGSGKSGVAHSVLLHERMNEEAGEGRKPHMWAHMPLTARVALGLSANLIPSRDGEPPRQEPAPFLLHPQCWGHSRPREGLQRPPLWPFCFCCPLLTKWGNWTKSRRFSASSGPCLT